MGLADSIEATTVETLRRRGSLKWTAPGPDGFGAGVAEMDFGTAPAVLAALAELSAGASFGYLPQHLADELGEATARWQQERYGWMVAPADVHPVADVIKGLELAITAFSRAGAPVILPTPAYMPFLVVPGTLGREVIQVPMPCDDAGHYRFDLDGIDRAFRAGGDLLVLCNPYNPLGRVFTAAELAGITEVVDRHGGRVFADEIHAPLVYRPARHVPYASTSETAAAHTLTATSASKAWNLPGLKCAEVILTAASDRATWQRVGHFASHGASTPGVVANAAAFRGGAGWLDEVLDYLDGSRALLGRLLAERLPAARYRPPEGTYLAWLDLRAVELPRSPGELITEVGRVLVVDGPAFGRGGPGHVRFNFATPRPVLDTMVTRLAGALTGG